MNLRFGLMVPSVGVLMLFANGCGSGRSSPVDCGSLSPEALAACVERDRYLADLEFVAAERWPGSAHWQAVQDLCAARFAEQGFEVERHAYGSGVNVIGVLAGTELAQERYLSAHYDHIPGCPGADDNASGVAGVLEAARVLTQGRYARTLVVACWDEEENSLEGSRAYVLRANERAENIFASYVFEMIGYQSDQPNSQSIPTGFELLFPEQVAELEARQYRGDFITLANDLKSAEPAYSFLKQADRLELPSVQLELDDSMKISPLVGDLQRSDHASFWYLDYPGIMITDTSEFRYDYYHCAGGVDDVGKLDIDFATRVVQATVGSAAEALELR